MGNDKEFQVIVKAKELAEHTIMAKLVEQGKISEEKYKESFQSWQAHARFGDCEKLIERFREIRDEKE